MGGDLKQSRKMTLDQSNYCIRYTSDIIASSRLDLIREQDAHGRDIDKANTVISVAIELVIVTVPLVPPPLIPVPAVTPSISPVAPLATQALPE